jgi:hypothetical protein
VDGVTLPIRAFLNADGTEIPPDPYGQAFTAWFSHPLFGNCFVHCGQPFLAYHGHPGALQRRFRSGQHQPGLGSRLFVLSAVFNLWLIIGVVQSLTTSYAQGMYDLMDIYNRQIGLSTAPSHIR